MASVLSGAGSGTAKCSANSGTNKLSTDDRSVVSCRFGEMGIDISNDKAKWLSLNSAWDLW